MAIFPKIQSPCPYKSELAAVMDGDFCRMCKRQVFDLTGWSDGERVGLPRRAAASEVCVSYRLPLRELLAAATLASLAAAPAAAANGEANGDSGLAIRPWRRWRWRAIEPPDEFVIVGGIKDPAHVEYVEDPADAAIPELPVVYEDADAAGAAAGPAR